MVLSTSDPAYPSNYPGRGRQTALSSRGRTGTLAAGNAPSATRAYATLRHDAGLSDGYTAGTSVVQTWEITSVATLAGIRASHRGGRRRSSKRRRCRPTRTARSRRSRCGALTFHGNVDDQQLRLDRGHGVARRRRWIQHRRRRRHERQHGRSGQRRRQRQPVIATNRRRQLHEGQRHGVHRLLGDSCAGLNSPPAAIVQLPTPPIPAPSAIAGPVGIGGASTCTNLGLTAANCSVSGSVVTSRTRPRRR